MKRILLIALSVAVLCASAAAEPIEVVPPLPTVATPIELHIPGFCAGVRFEMTRTGHRIELHGVETGCGMGDPPIFVTVVYSLGRLPVGRYDVVVTHGDEVRVVHSRTTFVVVEGARPFRIHPFAVPSDDTIPLELAIPYTGAVPAACSNIDTCTIRIGGVDATQRRFGAGNLYVVAPPHAPGLVDVTIGNLTSVNALYYFDRTTPPDLAVFERVLFPVLFDTRGAGGSHWVAETVISNPRSWYVETWNDIQPLACIVSPCGERLAPRTKVKFQDGEYPHGVALIVARADAEDLAFSLRVRDVSRVAQGFGSDVPVVREYDMFRSTLTLLNVPLDPRYRVKLRIYAFDVEDGAAGTIVGRTRTPFTFARPCGDVVTCASAPAYAEVDLAAGGADERTNLYIEVPDGALAWAFATVTNNSTQQVTIVTPDGTGGEPCAVCSVP